MPLSNSQPLLKSTYASYADKRRNKEWVSGGAEEEQWRRLEELDSITAPSSMARRSKFEEEDQVVAVQKTASTKRSSDSGENREGSSGPRRPHVANSRTMWVRHDFIYKVEFFKDCDPRFVDRILPGLDARLYLPGSVVIREGDEGNSMSIIHRGRTSITVGGNKVAELSDGACFGEIAVLGISSLRIATVTAIQMCDVRTLSRLHFLRVLSEFPSERARFKEMARRRAVATEGAAEQMQHRRQQRRLDLRHAISMERTILMGGIRLAKAQSLVGESPLALHPVALADAYDVRPGHEDAVKNVANDEEEVDLIEKKLDSTLHHGKHENTGDRPSSQSSTSRLAESQKAGKPQHSEAKNSSKGAVDNMTMGKDDLPEHRKQFRIQEVAVALHQELKKKGKLMLKYSQDFSKDLRNRTIKHKGTKGVAESIFDHISSPEKEGTSSSPRKDSKAESSSPRASPKRFGIGMPSLRRGAIQGDRVLVEKIQTKVAENEELKNAVHLTQWAEEHKRKLEHAKRIRASTEARIPKSVSYVLGIDDGHSLPTSPTVTGEDQEAPPSLDGTFTNTSLSLDRGALASLTKEMLQATSIYSGTADAANKMDGAQSRLASKDPLASRRGSKEERCASEPTGKQSPQLTGSQGSRGSARKVGKTSPLQMQKLKATARIFRAANPKPRPLSTPPSMGTPMDLSYEQWINEGAASALAAERSLSASREGAFNQTLSPNSSRLGQT